MRRRRVIVALALALAAGCEGVIGELGEPLTPETSTPRGPRVVRFTCDASQVPAEAPLTCAALATHPAGAAVRCTLGPGDGRAPLELGDCTTERTETLTFDGPATRTLTLTVRDDEGREAMSALVVEVTPRPNVAPVIDALSVTPARGVAPLNATLAWAVSDADGDAVRCDVEVDGAVRFADLDCASGGHALDGLGAGVHAVRLVATDGAGASDERSVTVEALTPAGDLSISRVDFGQSVVKQQLTLVDGKPALLRVSVVSDTAGLTARVVVEATLGAGPAQSLTLTGPATVPTTENLNDLSKQFRATLPAEWVKPGVQLTVRVDADDEVPETNEGNNEAQLAPTVSRGHVVHLTAVPIVQAGRTGTVRELGPTVTAVWPVRGVEAQTRAPYTTSIVLQASSTSTWSELLSQLAQVRSSDRSSRNYYGFVNLSYGSGIAGIGYQGMGVAFGRDDSLSTAAHELGHNFGRPHAPCGGVSGADPGYPYAGGKIGTQGWDGTKLIAPAQSYDLMTYCDPEWVSDYNYENVQQFLNGRGEFDPNVQLPNVEYADVALIAGRVLADGTVRWAPVQRILGEASAAPEGADGVVLLVGPDGVVKRVSVGLTSPAGTDERHFTTLVPWPGPLSAVAFEVGGRRLGERRASGAPVPAKATAERLDGHTVRVRWAGGAWAAVAHLGDERTTLALEASGGEVLVRTDGLEGGELEVSVSDGVASSRVALPMP